MTSSPDMRGLRRWWHRYLDLFAAEVRLPDGTRYLVSVNPTGFGECWLPIEIIDLEDGDIPVTV